MEAGHERPGVGGVADAGLVEAGRAAAAAGPAFRIAAAARPASRAAAAPGPHLRRRLVEAFLVVRMGLPPGFLTGPRLGHLLPAVGGVGQRDAIAHQHGRSDQDAVVGVDRNRAPVEAAGVARVLERPAAGLAADDPGLGVGRDVALRVAHGRGHAAHRWGEVALIAHLLELDAAVELIQRGQAPHVRLVAVLAEVRQGGDRLGRRQAQLASVRALRHRGFDDRVDRRAGAAVEQIDLAALGRLGDRRDHLAVLADIDQHRLRGRVVVPDIAVNGLEVPARGAGGRIYGDDGGGVFVGLRRAQVAGVVVGRGVAGRRVDQVELRVVAHVGPHVGRGAGELAARRGHAVDVGVAEVPGPDEAAVAGRVGADHTRGIADPLVVGDPAADHHDVAGDQGG